MSKLNLFIDVGNDDKDLPESKPNIMSLPAHIALVKNMEHVNTVFILANNNNKLQKEVSGTNLSNVVKEEYSATFVSFNTGLAEYKDKIVVYYKNNDKLHEEMESGKNLSSLANKALMIQYAKVDDVTNILNLLTEKHPKMSNIQLYASEKKEDESLLKPLNHIIKDAGAMRGLKINLMNQGQVGGLFGLFKTKKWDELAADIVKKVEKKDKKYVRNDGNPNIKLIEKAINEYYGLDKIKDKTSQKFYTARDNYKSA
jgi:hypothetical protein